MVLAFNAVTFHNVSIRSQLQSHTAFQNQTTKYATSEHSSKCSCWKVIQINHGVNRATGTVYAGSHSVDVQRRRSSGPAVTPGRAHA